MNALDRALDLAQKGEYERALNLATALLEAASQSPGVAFVVGQALAGLDADQAATDAFQLAAEGATLSGNLPLVLAACCELDRLGSSAALQLERAAEIYAKGSHHLAEQRAPPEFNPKVPDGAELSLAGGALISRASAAIDDARLALKSPEADLRVPPQMLFSALEPRGLMALAGALQELSVPSGETLIEEGTTGSEAYVLARGELEVTRRGKGGEAITLARLGAGAVFGEMSLLSRSPRAANVAACRPSVVLRIDREALDSVAAVEPDVARVLAEFTRQRMTENLVRTSSILSAVQSKKRGALLERFVTRTFEKGERLIAQDQESEGLYLVASGGLTVIHREDGESMAIAKLGPGDVVGEVALVLRRPSTADVIAEHATVTLHLPRERFLELIKAHPEVLAELYELAVRRDEETRSLVAQEATEAEDFVLL